jgi:uncharacterized protein (TIGR02599 family)
MKNRPAILPREGFTLVEMLVSLCLISLTMVILFQVTGATQRIWLDGRAKSSQFREARTAFEAMTRQLAQATLNTYWDYDNPGLPTKYVRQSDLHFVAGPTSTLLPAGAPTPTHAVFFQAPLGMVEQTANERLNGLMNSWGYYLKYDSDLASRPDFLSNGQRVPARVRHRLMEFRQPSEDFQVFARNLRMSISKTPADYYRWFSGTTELQHVSQPLAENVVALIVSPRLSLPAKNGAPDPAEYQRIAPRYRYDSREFQWATSSADRIERTRNQLPPTVLVTMVAIDEISARRLADSGQAANLVDEQWFQETTEFADDMAALEARLVGRRANYRTFTSTVTLRNSKWSE